MTAEHYFFRHMLSSITSTTDSHHDDTHELEGHHDIGPSTQILLFIPFCIFLGNVTRHINVELHIPLPYTVILLLIGFCLGIGEFYNYESMGVLGDAIFQIKTMDPHLLLGVFIPPLIFESAFGTDYHVIRREFIQALLLAGPGVIINVTLTSIFCKYAFPYEWTWLESITFSSIVSATDPVAVVALLRDLGASKRLATLIEGESLLNDGSAFVLFVIVLKFVLFPDNPPTGGQICYEFVVLTFGGIAMGLIFGIAVVTWLRLSFNDERVEIVITLIGCYFCFWVCENGFGEDQMSGVLGTVFLGLFVSKYKSAISPHVDQSLHHFWEVVGYIANTLIFLFGGIIVVLGIFEDSRLAASGREKVIERADLGWLVLLYIVIHAIRGLTISILYWPLKKTGYDITWQECVVLTFAGLRGVIALSLVLIVKLLIQDEEMHLVFYQDQVMFHVAGIVFLTLAINGTFMQVLVNKLGLLKMKSDTKIILNDAMYYLQQQNKKRIEELKGDSHFAGANWEQVIATLPSYAHIMGKEDKNSKRNKHNVCYYCFQYVLSILYRLMNIL